MKDKHDQDTPDMLDELEQVERESLYIFDDIEMEKVAFGIINRLGEAEKLEKIDQSWINNLFKYGLLYEVTRTSGLTLSDIEDIDDETFQNRVSYAMMEWDI